MYQPASWALPNNSQFERNVIRDASKREGSYEKYRTIAGARGSGVHVRAISSIPTYDPSPADADLGMT